MLKLPFDNFFGIGTHSHEILSSQDFRQCPGLANFFVMPTKERMTAALPLKGHVLVVQIKPEINHVNDNIFNIPKSERPVFSYELMDSEEFWIRPHIETADLISKRPFDKLDISDNTFFLDNLETDTMTFAHIVDSKAYCLSYPAKALKG